MSHYDQADTALAILMGDDVDMDGDDSDKPSDLDMSDGEMEVEDGEELESDEELDPGYVLYTYILGEKSTEEISRAARKRLVTSKT